MKSLSIRFALTAAVILAVFAFTYGCSEDSQSPAQPTPSKQYSLSPVSVTDCGAGAYLTALSPVLVSWQDSVEAWLGDGMLDAPPAYTDQSQPVSYLQTLVPVLEQWQIAINDSLGDTVIDTVPDFDPSTKSVPGYLVDLSNMLGAWKAALETHRDMVFLASPPVFEPDTTAPLVYCIADTTVGCADTNGVAVSFEVTATDDCDRSPGVTCDPPSGSKFYIGETLVTCTAVDSSGNSAECSFTVTVEAAEPPVITCPGDIVAECTGPEGTVVEFEATATSECDDSVDVSCDPPSGSAFPLGETTVTCTATDSFGNSVECTFTVTVEDTQPPVISCPENATIECTGNGGAVYEFSATATDGCDANPTVTCDPPSGSTFLLGETTVTCTAVDASGNSSECTFTVTVEDTQPPVILGATADPNRLWAPNHKMVDVLVSVDVEDICDPTPTCYIVDVTSNEAINGRGDGNTEPDWEITGDLTVKLRAERSGLGSGRVYYVLVRCEDDSGNGAEHTVEVIVPHDKRPPLTAQ